MNLSTKSFYFFNLYQTRSDFVDFGWLRLCQIDPPLRPSLFGNDAPRSDQFDFVSQTPNSQNLSEFGISFLNFGALQPAQTFLSLLRLLVLCKQNSCGNFCVKATRLNCRKASCIALIQRAFRQLKPGSFHAKNFTKNFVYRALHPHLEKSKISQTKAFCG